MPASKALGLYQAYERALERERLAWDHREQLKQRRSLDIAAYWEAQRAYERLCREQVQEWVAWGTKRQTNSAQMRPQWAGRPATSTRVF